MNELGNTPADKDYKPSGINKAEEAALKAYPYREDFYRKDGIARSEPLDLNMEKRFFFQQGYEQAEKDMKERFIQFVHRHYPINYIGWIQDFQKAMED